MGCGTSRDEVASPSKDRAKAVKSQPSSPNPSEPNTARAEGVRLEEDTTLTDTVTAGEVVESTPRSPNEPNSSNPTQPIKPTLEAQLSLPGHTASTLKTSDVPLTISRNPSGHDLHTVLSRQPSTSNDAEVAGVNQNQPPQRSRTFARRSSFGGGVLGSTNDENAWRTPKHAQELINQHLAEDPHCFRDHVALYWRLENVPAPRALSPVPQTPTILLAPTPMHPVSESRLQLHPSAAVTPSGSPALAPAPMRSASPLLPPPDQIFVFLSLGPSSGAGDKIGSSEYRMSESSISYYPMLLPYHALNGGDPNFSIQVQVWQKRVTSHASALSTNGVIMTLLGYVDVSVLNMFASFEKGQGLLIKSPPASVMNGQTPVPLAGTMLVVDYVQFYCHTTPAVTASPSRWPAALCTSASDCLWRGQIHAIKLGVPRGCPHPNLGGSMSPANGALMLNLKDLAGAANVGVCFVHIFRQVPQTPGSSGGGGSEKAQPKAPTGTPGLSSTPAASTYTWQLVHTSEFLPLSRNPKFAEFQRPLADICQGSYELPLLMQVVLSHDPVRSGELNQSMPADMMFTDPAAAVTQAIKSQGLAVCSLVQTITNMKELLAGKTKLKLHAPGMAPMPSPGDELMNSLTGQLSRMPTFNVDPNAGPITSTEDHQPQLLGHGTLAFNISQIFSSRASLEALARAKLAEAGKTPENDGFDEVGIVRSTAFLASLLPIGRKHHRPGSHLRGPSVVGDHHSSGSSHHHESSSSHHRSGSMMGGPTIQRSKTSGSSTSGGGLNTVLQGMNSSPGMATLLEKMGIASNDAPTVAGAQTDRKGSIKNMIASPTSKRRSM